MSPTIFENYVFGRRHFTKVKIDRWMSNIFSRKELICEEIKQTVLFNLNTQNLLLGMMSIICPTICMCEVKYIRNFTIALFVYIANEDRMVS